MNRLSVANLAGYIEATTRPLDRVRRLILRTIGAPLRPLVRSREIRVAVLGASGITVVWFASLLAPLRLLAVGPIVWGVPHLLADVRYLVVQPGLHRQLRLVAWAGPPLGFAALGGGVFAGLATCAAVIRILVALAPPLASTALRTPCTCAHWKRVDLRRRR